MKNVGIYRCPSDSFATGHDATYYGLAADRKPVAVSYMANSITPFYEMFGVAAPQGLITYGTEYSGGVATATTMAAVPASAEIVLLAEGRLEYSQGIFGCGEWLNNELDWCYVGEDVSQQYIIDFFTLSVPGDAWYRGWRRHANGANYAMADGHAKMLRPADVRDGKRWIVNPL